MATYRELHGVRVNVVSSNPSNPKEGEVWYNSTLGQLKGYVLAPATMSSGGNCNTGRTQLGGTGAAQTSGIIFGGETPSLTGVTEEYDGTSWTNGGTCPATKSDMHSSGTQTAALWGGGSPLSAETYEYDGSSWTDTGNMPFSNRDTFGGSCGTQTAALQVGGFINPGNYTNVMCEYNGSSWSNIPQTFPSAPKTGTFSTAGIQTACISAGPSRDSIEWDGSSWTTTNNLATGNAASAHQGTVSSSVLMTGPNPDGPTNYGGVVQTWDGTSWSNSPASASNPRSQAAGSGTSTAAYVAAGRDASDVLTATEEFDAAAVATKTLTTS